MMNKKKFIRGIQTLEEYHESMQELVIVSLQKQASFRAPKLDRPMSHDNYLRDLSEQRPKVSHYRFKEHRWRASELAQLMFGNRTLSRHAWHFIYTVIMTYYIHEHYYKCPSCSNIEDYSDIHCTVCDDTRLVFKKTHDSIADFLRNS